MADERHSTILGAAASISKTTGAQWTKRTAGNNHKPRACGFPTAQTPCTTATLHTLPCATNGTNVERAYTYATSTCQMSSCQNQN